LLSARAVAARWAAVKPGHVRLGPGFIDEDQFARVQARLLLAPFGARLGDVRTVLLGRPKDFF
jgi:hypothetical protein